MCAAKIDLPSHTEEARQWIADRSIRCHADARIKSTVSTHGSEDGDVILQASRLPNRERGLSGRRLSDCDLPVRGE